MMGKEVIKKYDFKFNKKFGQNFIFDTNLLNAIVDDAGVDENTVVLEIGCGAGTLTRAIAKKAKKIVGYEIDQNLKPILDENLADLNNVEIVFGDIMEQKMSEIESRLGEDYVLIANLPYYITTPIIFKFLEEAKSLKRLVIMVQLEVAERLTAKPNTPNYGAITAQIDYRANTKITRVVKRNMFTPAPNVDSAVVRIDFVEKYSVVDEKTLNLVIKSAFQMRRKTLANNLKNTFGFSADECDKILMISGIDSTTRGEVLGSSQFVLLSNVIATWQEVKKRDNLI